MGICESKSKNHLKKDSLSHDNIANDENKISNIYFVNFISQDLSINITIPCSRIDKFSELKEKLYQKYPEARYKNLYFIHNCSLIKESLTIGENDINDGDKIIIIEKNKNLI